MNTYFSILEKLPGSKLRLTKYDDEILEHFNKDFPDFDLKATINEDEMKSKEGKERWRTFINAYENKIEDFNFGTMLRADAAREYDEKGTIFGKLRALLVLMNAALLTKSSQLCGCSSTLLKSLGG